MLILSLDCFVDAAARNRERQNHQRRSAELLPSGGAELAGAAVGLRHDNISAGRKNKKVLKSLFRVIINLELQTFAV